jgi:hypothetical protein
MSRAQAFQVRQEKKQTSYSGHSGYQRVLHDYYREPARAVDALLDFEAFTGSVYDPFCGGGTIPARCRARGFLRGGAGSGYPLYGPGARARTHERGRGAGMTERDTLAELRAGVRAALAAALGAPGAARRCRPASARDVRKQRFQLPERPRIL